MNKPPSTPSYRTLAVLCLAAGAAGYLAAFALGLRGTPRNDARSDATSIEDSAGSPRAATARGDANREYSGNRTPHSEITIEAAEDARHNPAEGLSVISRAAEPVHRALQEAIRREYGLNPAEHDPAIAKKADELADRIAKRDFSGNSNPFYELAILDPKRAMELVDSDQTAFLRIRRVWREMVYHGWAICDPEAALAALNSDDIMKSAERARVSALGNAMRVLLLDLSDPNLPVLDQPIDLAGIESFGTGLPNEVWRTLNEFLATMTTASGPEAALKWYRESISSEFHPYGTAITEVAATIPGFEPNGDFLEKIGISREYFLRTRVLALASADPDAASAAWLRVFDGLDDESEISSLSGTAKQLVEQSPELAAAILDGPASPGRKLVAEAMEVQSLVSKLRNGTGIDEEQWESLPDAVRNTVVSDIFKETTRSDFDPGRGVEWLRSGIADSISQETLRNILIGLGTSYPEVALANFDLIADSESRQKAREKVFLSWGKDEPWAVSEFVNALPPGEARDGGALALALNQAPDDPEAALYWLAEVQDSERRQSAATAVRQISSVPINEVPISEELRKRLPSSLFAQ